MTYKWHNFFESTRYSFLYLLQLLIVLTTLISNIALGEPILVTPEKNKISLNKSLYVLKDSKGTLTINEVTNSPWKDKFSLHTGVGNNLGVTRGAFWIKLEFKFPKPNETHYLLEIAYAPLDELTIYMPNGKGGLRIIATGDSKRFSQRDIEHHNFVFRLPEGLQNQSSIFLRLANRGAILAPTTLWKEQTFFQNKQTEQLVSGIYYGVLIALAIFNLFIYFSVRDSSYLWYVGYLSGIGMFFIAFDGMALRYFWPDSPKWGNYALYVFLVTALFSGLGFARTMLNLSIFAPLLNKLMFWTAWLMPLYLLSGLYVDKYIMTSMLPYLGLLVLVLSSAAVFSSVRAGYKPAWFVAIAFLAILPGGLLLSFRILGIVPDNVFTAHSFQIGVAVEALLLSFALAYRIRLLNTEISNSHRLMSESKKEFTRKLLEVRDDELRKTASELHDGVGQNLMVLSNRLRSLHKHATDTLSKDRLRFSLDVVQDTIRDIRRMSHHLHPHQLERLGLKIALQETINHSFEGTKIRVDYQIDELDNVISANMKLHIYRIVQECIKNIVTHSNASRAYLEIKNYQSNIDIWIEDNGDGVSIDTHLKDSRKLSFGITSIKERVQSLGGSIELNSTKKTGLVISVTLPVRPETTDG